MRRRWQVGKNTFYWREIVHRWTSSQSPKRQMIVSRVPLTLCRCYPSPTPAVCYGLGKSLRNGKTFLVFLEKNGSKWTSKNYREDIFLSCSSSLGSEPVGNQDWIFQQNSALRSTGRRTFNSGVQWIFLISSPSKNSHHIHRNYSVWPFWRAAGSVPIHIEVWSPRRKYFWWNLKKNIGWWTAALYPKAVLNAWVSVSKPKRVISSKLSLFFLIYILNITYCT